MDWTWVTSSHPISDVRDWSKRQRLEVRPDFQRKEVWSMAARISLMDTILRNIPMPKIFMEALIKEEDTYRRVIDGQQRIKAILSFLADEYALEKPYGGSFANLKFSQLPPDARDRVLSYKIDVNEIRNAPDLVVRDIYLRVNKYTVALNKQELRRADFPGDYLSLSEELVSDPFFEQAGVFTIANSRRMKDVEYISELLALLIAGPQEKQLTLDNFYIALAKWPEQDRLAIENRFKAVLSDLAEISNAMPSHPQGRGFKDTRFRQKADFYSLFAAIDDCRVKGGSLNHRNLTPLAADMAWLNLVIAPESEHGLPSLYAIKCVSQGNTHASRKWRRNFLRRFLQGTYFGTPPDEIGVAIFHSIRWDENTPTMCRGPVGTCPVCKREDITDYSPSQVFLTWRKTNETFQMNNAEFVHNSCCAAAASTFYIWQRAYPVDRDVNTMAELLGDNE